MPLPDGVVCKNCGQVMGVIIARDEKRLPLGLEFACSQCVNAVAKAKNLALDSDESWGEVIAEMGIRR